MISIYIALLIIIVSIMQAKNLSLNIPYAIILLGLPSLSFLFVDTSMSWDFLNTSSASSAVIISVMYIISFKALYLISLKSDKDLGILDILLTLLIISINSIWINIIALSFMSTVLYIQSSSAKATVNLKLYWLSSFLLLAMNNAQNEYFLLIAKLLLGFLCLLYICKGIVFFEKVMFLILVNVYYLTCNPSLGYTCVFFSVPLIYLVFDRLDHPRLREIYIKVINQYLLQRLINQIKININLDKPLINFEYPKYLSVTKEPEDQGVSHRTDIVLSSVLLFLSFIILALWSILG